MVDFYTKGTAKAAIANTLKLQNLTSEMKIPALLYQFLNKFTLIR